MSLSFHNSVCTCNANVKKDTYKIKYLFAVYNVFSNLNSFSIRLLSTHADLLSVIDRGNALFGQK